MHIRFLGTGTSTGIPEIGCKCEVCQSLDERDKRLRSSLLISEKNKQILIDCGPDFREQMLRYNFFNKIDGVLLTHEHYDHVGGIDDLRPFCRFGNVNIYAEDSVANAIEQRIPYCFTENKYPGVPELSIKRINNKSFNIEDIEITPIRVLHGTLPILGYKIGKIAYITDMKNIPENEYAKLKDLDILIMNALRIKEHLSHQNLEQALVQAKRIGAKQTYLIHMSHHLGLHSIMEHELPENVSIAYDCLEIHI